MDALCAPRQGPAIGKQQKDVSVSARLDMHRGKPDMHIDIKSRTDRNQKPQAISGGQWEARAAGEISKNVESQSGKILMPALGELRLHVPTTSRESNKTRK